MSIIPFILEGETKTIVNTREDYEQSGGLEGKVILIKNFDSHQIDSSREVELDENQSFLIYPGDFILGSTIENITLPNHLVAKIDGRSSLGRLGLMIQTSASHVSPGFSGHITLEIKNISNIA